MLYMYSLYATYINIHSDATSALAPPTDAPILPVQAIPSPPVDSAPYPTTALVSQTHQPDPDLDSVPLPVYEDTNVSSNPSPAERECPEGSHTSADSAPPRSLPSPATAT